MFIFYSMKLDNCKRYEGVWEIEKSDNFDGYLKAIG